MILLRLVFVNTVLRDSLPGQTRQNVFLRERRRVMKLVIVGITTLATLCSMGQVAAADGKAVYDKYCAACHKSLPKAPKLGDKDAWAPLIARGSKDLIASAMKGKAPMPPRGMAKNEEEVAAAVEYMINAAK